MRKCMTWDEIREKGYHTTQKGIHQKNGQIISVMGKLEGTGKYPSRISGDGKTIYFIGEWPPEQIGDMYNTKGNQALINAVETKTRFNVVRKHRGRNCFEFLGKWYVDSYSYEKGNDLIPYRHYIFVLKKTE